MLIQTKQLCDESAILVPRLFGTLAIIIALIVILIKTTVFLRDSKKVSMAEEKFIQNIEGEGAMNFYIVVALCIIYLILTQLIGFILGTTVIILAFLWFAKYRRVLRGLIFSIITSLTLYFLFYIILKVNLPRGIIF